MIVASKSGDVYRYPRDLKADAIQMEPSAEKSQSEKNSDPSDSSDGGQLLLGHVSMVLDLVGP